MELAVEAGIVQNTSLGSALIWNFTVEFYKQSRRDRGPSFPLVLLVLPMTLHRETMMELHNRNYEGGLDLALAENRLLTSDLQERMEAMFPQTMSALNVAFGAGLLDYERELGELRPIRMTNPFQIESAEVRRMMNTAVRIGYWFCTINIVRIGSLLRVRL